MAMKTIVCIAVLGKFDEGKQERWTSLQLWHIVSAFQSPSEMFWVKMILLPALIFQTQSKSQCVAYLKEITKDSSIYSRHIHGLSRQLSFRLRKLEVGFPTHHWNQPHYVDWT